LKHLSSLKVLIDGVEVGTLTLTPSETVAFQYSAGWLRDGFSLNPFSLPLTDEVFVPKNRNGQGLFGVFEDSLPDAWGTLLTNRLLQQKHIAPQTVNVLDRLAFVGNRGKGDMVYAPEKELASDGQPDLSFDEIKAACDRVLASAKPEDLDVLYPLGGTAGGARPKINAVMDDEDWLIKFPLKEDPADMGKMEYDYARCAAHCGIAMSEVRLFPSQRSSGFFGTKRFDRGAGHQKKHVSTVKALLELPFDTPSIDYTSLLQLTNQLTHGDAGAVEQMFRIACFNVFAHNQDDHSKNFSFLYDKAAGRWQLAPAYDLTCSTTAYNEHTTSVNWNGRNPDEKDLLQILKNARVEVDGAEAIIQKIKNKVDEALKNYIEKGA
jgi:serine/threonine-protein kinase HipA